MNWGLQQGCTPLSQDVDCPQDGQSSRLQDDHFSLPDQVDDLNKHMPGPNSLLEQSFGQRNGHKYLSLVGMGQDRGRYKTGLEFLKGTYPKELKAES